MVLGERDRYFMRPQFRDGRKKFKEILMQFINKFEEKEKTFYRLGTLFNDLATFLSAL